MPAVRKRSFWVWKTMQMISSPTTIGSEPSSPDLTSVHQRRAYAPRVSCGALGIGRGRCGDGAHATASCWPGTFESWPAVIASTTSCWLVSLRLNSDTF